MTKVERKSLKYGLYPPLIKMQHLLQPSGNEYVCDVFQEKSLYVPAAGLCIKENAKKQPVFAPVNQ